MSRARVAILNPHTLLGKELQENLEGRLGADVALELYTTATQGETLLTEVQGAAGLIQPWRESSLDGVALSFLCGPSAELQAAREALPSGCTAIVLTADAGTEIGRPVVSGINDRELEPGRIYLSPHPGAVALAHLLSALSPLGLRQAVATVVQPASLYDEEGLEGLFEETRALLSFRDRSESSPFAAQVAFNLVPAEVGMPPLGEITQEILGDIQPAVQLLQGGFFHGLAVSLYIGLAEATRKEEVESALRKTSAIEMVAEPQELGPVSTANRSELLVGSVQPVDDGGTFWLWSALDNLTRGGALNAIEVAARLFPDLLH